MQALKKRVLLCLMCYSMAFAQEAPEYTWAKSPRANSFDIPTALDLDDDENIYSSGLFTTRITFDQITLERPNVDGVSKFGSYICKHDKNGEVQWAVATQGFSVSKISDLEMSKSNILYAIGTFKDFIILDDDSINASNPDKEELFLFTLDRNGTWLDHITASATNNIRNLKITTDDNDNIYIAGVFSGTLQIGGQSVSDNTNNIFLAKLNKQLECQWIQSYKAGYYHDDSEPIGELTLDHNNNLLLVGNYREFLNINDNINLSTGSQFSSNVFIAKFNNNGEGLWAQSAGGRFTDYGYSVDVLTNNNIAICGRLSGSMEINNEQINAGNGNFFAAILDSDGNWESILTKADVGSHLSSANSIQCDANNNCYITGFYRSTTSNFIIGSDTITRNSNYNHFFYAKFNSSGEWLWAKNGESKEISVGDFIRVNKNNDLVISGNYMEEITLGDFTLAKPRFAAVNARNSFLCSVDQNMEQSGVESFSVIKNHFKIYPNPCFGQLNVSISNFSQHASIQVFDLNYQLVYSQPMGKLDSGQTQMQIDLRHLKTGMYIIRYSTNNEVFNHKVMVQ